METTQCPRCQCRMSRVLETRQTEIFGLLVIRRKRSCRHCKKQFITKETIDENVEIFQPNKKNKPTEQPPDLPPITNSSSEDNPFFS